MRTLVMTTLCAAGCFSKPGPPMGHGNADAAIEDVASDARTIVGGFRRLITVNMPPTEALVRFPLAVAISGDMDLGTHASGPEHIAFATLTNEALDCEIVEYDANSGVLEAWVTIPVLPTLSSQFQLVYGSDIQSPCTSTKPKVWSEYAGAWHFADVLVASPRDSSMNAVDFTGAFGLATEGPGVLGRGLRVDPADSDGADTVCAATRPVLELGLQSFTYELWVHPFSLVGEYDVVMTKGGQTAGQAGFDLELGRNQWNAWIRDSSTPVGVFDLVTFVDDGQFMLNTWSHLAVVVDRSKSSLFAYLNGIRVDTDSSLETQSVSGSSPLCLGDESAASDGLFDEPRVHSVARSAAWIRTSYLNLTEPLFLFIDPTATTQ